MARLAISRWANATAQRTGKPFAKRVDQSFHTILVGRLSGHDGCVPEVDDWQSRLAKIVPASRVRFKFEGVSALGGLLTSYCKRLKKGNWLSLWNSRAQFPVDFTAFVHSH